MCVLKMSNLNKQRFNLDGLTTSCSFTYWLARPIAIKVQNVMYTRFRRVRPGQRHDRMAFG